VASYIKELRSAVMEKPLLDDGLLFRGVELSDMEIAEMENVFVLPVGLEVIVLFQLIFMRDVK